MHKDFWKRVRNLINEYGLKLAEIENALDLPNSYISVGTLRGGLPRADTILKLADFFGVSFRWLVTGEDEVDESISKCYKIASNPQLLELANKLSYCNPELHRTEIWSGYFGMNGVATTETWSGKIGRMEYMKHSNDPKRNQWSVYS